MKTLKVLIPLASIIFLLVLARSGSGQSIHKIIDRHNYGFLWRKTDEVGLSVATAKMVLHYKLPHRIFHIDEGQINCSRRAFGAIRGTMCLTIHGLLTEFRNLRVNIQKHVKTQIDNLYEVFYEFTATSRQLRRGFLTDSLSRITGLATIDEINNLKDIMRTVESGVEQAARLWKSGSSHFMTAIKIEKTRIDNIYAVISMHRKSIIRLQSELVGHWAQSNTRAHFLAQMIKTVAALTFQISEIDDLYAAMSMLNTKRLPHFLVNHALLDNALGYLQHHLQLTRPDLRVLHTDHHFYYTDADFNVFRFNSLLLIVVHVPLTLSSLLKPLDVYQLVHIPLSAPHATDHYSMLETDFEAVAYNPDVDYMVIVKDMKRIPRTTVWDLEHSELSLISRSVPTCALMLLEGDLSSIKKFCSYRIHRAQIPRGITKLNQNTFLFTNISKLTFRCNSNDTEIIYLSELQVVHTLDCSCFFWADEWFLPHSYLDCDLENFTFTLEAKFVVNLPYLTEFFEEELTKYISSETYLNDTITAILPPLAVAGKAYDAKLAVEHKAVYDMLEVLNETKQDSVMFDNLAHYLYNVLLSSHTQNPSFDLWNPYDWLLMIASVSSFLALILAIILRLRVRTLFLLLAGIRRANAVEGSHKIPQLWQFTLSPPKAATNVSNPDYLSVFREILPVDILILLCFVFLLLFLALNFCYQLRRRRNVRTSLILEIGNQSKSYSWSVIGLPYPPSYYSFSIDASQVAVRLVEYFLSASVYWSSGFSITNICTEYNVPLPETVSVSPWQLRAFRSLMNDRHYAVLHVLNGLTSELVVAIPLKANSVSITRGHRGDNGNNSTLYPTVDLQNIMSA